MATQDSPPIAAQDFPPNGAPHPAPEISIPTPAHVPAPSIFWSRYQSLKGLNATHLLIRSADLTGKWIVLTGGNSGIGREAALQFAKWGANIILGLRAEAPSHELSPDTVVKELKDAARKEGHVETTVEWWECDMADLSSVETFGKRWEKQMGKKGVDLLINNAGIAPPDGKRVKLTRDGFEIVHQVNFISHVLLTHVLLPSLALSPTPRIICTVSSMQYEGTFDLRNANAGISSYAHNKLYFQTWLTELQSRLLSSPNKAYNHIVIHGVHPGFVNTNIWVNPKKGKIDTSDWVGKVLKWVLERWAIDSQQGSLAILNAATKRELGWQGEAGKGGGGKFLNRIWELEPMPQTKDKGCRSALWEFVNAELGLEGRGLLGDLSG